ncbi:hypothetical protein K435DRAFT_812502 [Dendrothele bispora CBS 962.96]|uniref:Transmembrane protein n=1 Tax=Dendrothele bispora (strain CBS 962.96) TaxID=1314807 RepID=A0A4S8KNY3_DENBC|nr:hypothetical protein K435DRAFT_812502 [Dendrothele bispora CBS 962.96]
MPEHERLWSYVFYCTVTDSPPNGLTLYNNSNFKIHKAVRKYFTDDAILVSSLNLVYFMFGTSLVAVVVPLWSSSQVYEGEVTSYGGSSSTVHQDVLGNVAKFECQRRVVATKETKEERVNHVGSDRVENKVPGKADAEVEVRRYHFVSDGRDGVTVQNMKGSNFLAIPGLPPVSLPTFLQRFLSE